MNQIEISRGVHQFEKEEFYQVKQIRYMKMVDQCYETPMDKSTLFRVYRNQQNNLASLLICLWISNRTYYN